MNAHRTSTEMGLGRGNSPLPQPPSPKTKRGRLHKSLDTPSIFTIRGSPQTSISVTLIIHGQLIVLCHYALRVWNRSNRGSWHLSGHSHGRLPQVANYLSMDVGADTHDFCPWHFDEIKNRMSAGVPD